MTPTLLGKIIDELDEPHLRELVRQYASTTDYGAVQVVKALADQEEF